MKKILFALAFMALLLTGCQKEKFDGSTDNGETVKVNVSVAIENADPATRASWDNDGNGACVDRWIMEVYDKQGVRFDRQVKTGQSGLTNTFSVILVKNQEYKFAFWADKEGSYNVGSLRTVKTVSTVAGLDSRDAFFAEKDYTSSKSETITAELYRPFAQINIVTRDLKKLYEQMTAAGTTVDYAKFKPKELKLTCKTFNQFDVLTGNVSDEKESALTIAECYADYSAHAEKTTIFMDYLFAGEAKGLKDLKFTFKSNEVAISYDFANIPLQRNYRTNISGNLLSNDATVNVEIIPIWKEPDYEEEAWSAGMVTPVTPDEQGVYNINLPSELAWIAQQVNNGETFAGKTVKLAKDIDLNNGRWTPIGKSDVISFKGTFEGNGKTIKNLNIDLGTSSLNVGLFSFVSNGTVRNFTVDGAKVAAGTGAAAVVAGMMFPGGLIEKVSVKNVQLAGCRQMGGIAGSIYGKVLNCTAENVEITATPNLVGGVYDNGDKCGAIVGFSTFDNNGGEVSGNIAKTVVIKGYRDIGGIVGAADCNATTITGNEVHGAELTADQTVNFYGKKDYNVGAIVGRVNAGTVDASNTSENVITKTIGNAAEKALDEATEGSTVTLKDVDSGNTVNIPAGFAKNVTIASDAVDKSEVSRFEIPAGAKIENLTIKDFEPTLQAGPYSPFVHIPADASFSMTVKDVKATGDGVKGNANTLVRVESCDNADLASEIAIDGVEIDGAKYLIYAPGGSRAISLTIKNCIVKNLTSWMALANGSQFKNVTIENCVIENCQGICKFNGMVSFTFKNNTLIGKNGENHSATSDGAKCFADWTYSATSMTISGNTSNGVNCDDAILAKTF